MNFAIPADHRGKLKEIEKRDKYLDLTRELKKSVEIVGDGDTNYNWSEQSPKDWKNWK